MTMPLVDPRGGKLCSNCNAPLPTLDLVRWHCENRRCGWWYCARCRAWNDPQGRNSETDLAGRSKKGNAR